MEATPWRLSILDGVVVDLVLDNETSQNSPSGRPRQLVLRIANLVPSFDTQRSAFLIAPPEDQWPPPVQGADVRQGGPNPPGPAEVSSPTFAPSGRTGLPDVDDDIDALLSQKAGDLRKTFGDIAGKEEACELGNGPYCSNDFSRVPLDEWTDRLASGKRTLYSVSTLTFEHIAIVIAVDSGGDAAEAWRFVSWDGEITELSIYLPVPISQFGSSIAPSDYFWSRVRGAAPQPDNDYARFYVLPPRDLLPQVPAGYNLSVRAGDAGVDALLAVVAARNNQGLVSMLATPNGTLFRGCGRSDETLTSTAIAAWAASKLPTTVNLASVVDLPDSYYPAADHLLVFRTEVNPLLWSGFGLAERDGKIIGVFDAEQGCQVEVMYPPPAYVVPPPAGGVAGLDPARRSGLPLVDAVLDAGYAGDAAAMDKLISYGTPCGYEYAPPCPPGAAPGTLVEALNSTACHGGYVERKDAPRALIELIQSSAMYGIREPGSTNGVANPPTLIMVSTNANRPGPVSLAFDAKGVSAISRNCNGLGPDWLLGGGTPNFLLPPK